MAGRIAHKVVVDINLTSVDEKEENDELTDEDVVDDVDEDDDDGVMLENDDEEEEMDTSVAEKKRCCRRRSTADQRDRPKRQRKKKQLFNWSNLSWSYREKKLLLGALKKYPPSAIDQLQEEVPSKTKLQIKDYLNKINKSIQWKSDDPMPIIDWTNMGRDLVRAERNDYTDSLARAMSIISNFEEHPKPAARVPDYKAIYRYLALVLEGKELPILGPLESAVMLDLLHGVVDKVEMSETTQQRRVMKWKYKLLSGKVDTANHHLFIKDARKALSNDFSDFEDKTLGIKQETGTQNSEATSKTLTTQPESVNIAPTTSSGKPSTSAESSQSLSINEARSDMPSGSQGQIKASLKSNEVEAVGGNVTDSGDRIKLIEKRDVMGNTASKGDGTTSTTERERLLVKRQRDTQPHSDSESISHQTCANITNSQQSNSETAGDLNQPTSADQNGPTDSKSDGPPSEKKRRMGRPPKGVYRLQEDREKISQELRRSGRMSGTRKFIPEQRKKEYEDPNEIPKKPSLYTLNPFCVPVSLLPLRGKQALRRVRIGENQKCLPAIVTKKTGPKFNKQRREGISTISIHRMAAIIPVSKQHVLLPNSASQKSLASHT